MPDDDRRDFAGGDGDHGLVEQRHALGGSPSRISAAPAMPGDRHQVRVAEALADLGGLSEGGVGGRGVALDRCAGAPTGMSR